VVARAAPSWQLLSIVLIGRAVSARGEAHQEGVALAAAAAQGRGAVLDLAAARATPS
jgi:hypothetical protein